MPVTGLRTLGTRRPFTPRDAQRTLFAHGERSRMDRPPSALNMRHLRLQATGSSFDDTSLKNLLQAERPANASSNHKMAQRRSKSFHLEESLTPEENHSNIKLPQLNGQAKPLHRRTLDPMRCLSEENEDTGYESTIDQYSRNSQSGPKERSSADVRRKHFSINKSRSVDSEPFRLRNNTSVETNSDRGHSDTGSDFDSSESSFHITRIAVQMPSPSSEIDHESFDGLHTTLNEPEEKSKYTEQQALVKNWSLSDSLVETKYKETITKTDETRLINDLLENLTLQQDEKYQDEKIVELLSKLYDLLDRCGLWHSINGKVKTAILKTLYGHVESDDDRILMGIAKILLAMRVTGSNLSAVFKLLFKVSRNDRNDYLFKSGNILELLVEGMGRACPLSEAECCVYAGGVLRFTSLDAGLREGAQQAGAVHLLALHLKLINNAKAESPRSVSEQTSHALYQLTGALRHLAEPLPSPPLPPSRSLDSPPAIPPSPSSCSIFVSSGALEQLCKTLDLFITDLDVLTNVTRTLSVLSAERACCMWLGARTVCCGAALRALAAAASRPKLAVRLAYALGNVAAYSDEGRINIYSEPGSIDCLLTVMEIYQELCTNDSRSMPKEVEENADLFLLGSDLAGSSGSNEDVLVKTIRVLANICMNASAGLALARSDSCSRACRCLLAVARLPTAAPTAADDELPAAALAAINNLSYYHDGEEGPLDDIMWELCEVSCRHVSSGGSARAGAEAVRALGNLSRSRVVRDQLLRSHAHVDAIAAYLHDEDASVRHAAAGVVVNVCGGGGVGGCEGVAAWCGAACDALSTAAGLRDYRLGALLTRALWNGALRDRAGSEGALDLSRAAELLDQMIDDEQTFSEYISEDDPDYENFDSVEGEHSFSCFAAWEDFATVAIALLDRLGPALNMDSDHDRHPIVGDIGEVRVSTDCRDLVQI